MTFKINDQVVWLHEPRGGYGYIYPVNAKITRITLKKIQIEVVKKNGEKVCRWVLPEKLKGAL
jgi:hypothetical protein